jgi:hypothetical protein
MHADAFMDYDDDILRSMADKSEVYCLQICIFEEAKRQGPSGLILRTDNGGNYHRIGLFHFRPLEIYDIEEDESADITNLVGDAQGAQRAASESFENSILETVIII